MSTLCNGGPKEQGRVGDEATGELISARGAAAVIGNRTLVQTKEALVIIYPKSNKQSGNIS